MIETLTSGFHGLIEFVNGVHPFYLYLILFSVAFMENIIPPIPGDTFTIIGGYLAATGQLEVLIVFFSIVSGSMASIMLIYMLGYRGGREYFIKKNYRFFSAMDIEKITSWFSKYGNWLILVSRFVVGIRVAIIIVAGVSKHSPSQMALFSGLSTVLFHGALIALAFLLQASIGSLNDGFSIYSKIVLVIVVVLIILWLILIIKRINRGRKQT